MATLIIELGDGTSFEMEERQWRIAASATGIALHHHNEAISRLVVRIDGDNRVLICVEIETTGNTMRVGDLLPPESPGIIKAMQRIATLYGLPADCFESCLEQLYRK
jgi:hypothetical protein